MTTTELIKALRDCNKNICSGCVYTDGDYPDCFLTLMQEAADRLEELDERVAIMTENEVDEDADKR